MSSLCLQGDEASVFGTRPPPQPTYHGGANDDTTSDEEHMVICEEEGDDDVMGESEPLPLPPGVSVSSK